MTTVLVTGAGGYIGQRLALRLASEGHTVRALVRRAIEWPPAIQQIVGDLVAQPDLAEVAARGADAVVHLAGANEVAMAQNPDRELADAVTAATRIADSGVGRVLYLSTVHVYGDALAPGAVISEDTVPRPTHPYAVARLACEDVFAQRALPVLVFRLTNGVGAPARPDVGRWTLIANELCREGVLTGRITLRTPGTQWRDFVALSDVDSILCDLLGRETIPTGLFNLGSGSPLTVRGLADLVLDSLVRSGEPQPALDAPPPLPDPPEPYRIDVDRLRALNVRPETPLSAAVDETVRFCQAHRDVLR